MRNWSEGPVLGNRVGALWVIVLLAMGLALAACDQGEKSETTASETLSDAAPGADQPAISAFLSEATSQTLVEPVIGTGTIAAHKVTDLGPSIDGVIDEIYVHVGARVSKGDPLFKTRDVDVRLKVAEAENELKLAKAQRRNADQALQRVKTLAGKGIVSGNRLEDAQARHSVAVAREGVAGAKLNQARQALKDAVVRAPFDGVITRRDIDEGKFMATRTPSIGENGGVLQISKIDLVAAIVEVPEPDLSRISLGTPAKVHLDALGKSVDADITVINDRVDPVRRAVEVRLAIPNENYEVKPGLFARAEILPPARSILALDRRAVQGTEAEQYVFLLEDGKAKRRPVRTAQVDASRVEVLEGLDAGDKVLTGPNLPLIVEGTPIAIETDPDISETVSPAAPPATASNASAPPSIGTQLN